LTVGSIVSILGIIFHFQGKSVIGPETSFMYSNPAWVVYGVEISAAGIFIVSTGFIVNIIERKKSKK